MRFNLVSTIWQMEKDGHALPITNVVKLKSEKNKYAITYPASNYEFAEFTLEPYSPRI